METFIMIAATVRMLFPAYTKQMRKNETRYHLENPDWLIHKRKQHDRLL
jgi:hypothetical protein